MEIREIVSPEGTPPVTPGGSPPSRKHCVTREAFIWQGPGGRLAKTYWPSALVVADSRMTWPWMSVPVRVIGILSGWWASRL